MRYENQLRCNARGAANGHAAGICCHETAGHAGPHAGPRRARGQVTIVEFADAAPGTARMAPDALRDAVAQLHALAAAAAVLGDETVGKDSLAVEPKAALGMALLVVGSALEAAHAPDGATPDDGFVMPEPAPAPARDPAADLCDASRTLTDVTAQLAIDAMASIARGLTMPNGDARAWYAVVEAAPGVAVLLRRRNERDERADVTQAWALINNPGIVAGLAADPADQRDGTPNGLLFWRDGTRNTYSTRVEIVPGPWWSPLLARAAAQDMADAAERERASNEYAARETQAREALLAAAREFAARWGAK